MSFLESIIRAALYAAAVSDFFNGLPEILGRHIFRHILDQCDEQAMVIAPRDRFNMMVSSIIDNYNPLITGSDMEFDNLKELLGLDSSVELKRKPDGPEVRDRLKLLLDITSFDSPLMRGHELFISGLLSSYECFRRSNCGELTDTFIEKIETLLMSVNDMLVDRKDGQSEGHYLLDQMQDYVCENPYDIIGYQTAFDRAINSFDELNMLSDEDARKFYAFYCCGQILDQYLDCVYINRIPVISRSMMTYLQQSCESNPALYEVVMKRHAFLKSVDRSIPDLGFVVPKLDITKYDVKFIAVHLPTIKKEVCGNESISIDQLSQLFTALARDGYIAYADSEKFMKAFSGERFYITKKLEWLKSQQTLARFLYLASSKKEISDNYFKRAIDLFCRRDGKSCQKETLARKYRVEHDMDHILRIFRQAGINR